MAIAVSVVALVSGCWWILDHVDHVSNRRIRSRVARIVLITIVGSMFVLPAAYQSATEWFIERKSNEILEWIQPAIDDLIPPTTVVSDPARNVQEL